MTPFSSSKQMVGLIAWLALCFLAAAVGAAASIQSTSFYAEIVRPDWAPPAWLFGPVWTLLYVMMAVAAWLVWRKRGLAGARIALTLFVVQLVFNGVWTWLFFGWKMGGLAFADILVLWVLILSTLIAFWRIKLLAGALLIPYLLWVSFASVLNYSIWQMNPGSFGG